MTEEGPDPFSFGSFAARIEAGTRVVVDSQFIGGGWSKSASPRDFDVISPTTEEPVATVRAASQADVEMAVDSARSLFLSGAWTNTDVETRISIVERVSAMLEAKASQIARVQTEQMGAPITSTRSSVARRVVANMKSNIRAARELPTRFALEDAEGITLVERRPVGVVAAILPWNAPLSFEADKVTAALLAGCSVVLKAAPEAPLEAFALATMFRDAGLPAGALNVVAGGGDVGEWLVSHPYVDRVTFTGSTMTGRRIAEICARRFARVGLELGGKSPAIVLEDADLERAAKVLAGSNFGNAGQSCHALTRVLVPRKDKDDFIDLVRTMAESLIIGDPRRDETQLGPLVSERQRDRVEGYLALAKATGARIAAGGGRPPLLDRGWFIEPTVLADVTNDMRVAREEIFGPVMCLLTFDSEEEAIAIANDSEYGLGGAVFSSDPDHGLGVALRINTGMCSVNSWGMSRSAPFGGVRQSGVGREHGLWGIASCLETHAIRPVGNPLAHLDVQSARGASCIE